MNKVQTTKNLANNLRLSYILLLAKHISTKNSENGIY